MTKNLDMSSNTATSCEAACETVTPRRELQMMLRERLRLLEHHHRAARSWRSLSPVKRALATPPVADPACAGATPDDSTLLCAVQAHLRGRLHMTRWRSRQEGHRVEIPDLETQEKWIRARITERVGFEERVAKYKDPWKWWVGPELRGHILGVLESKSRMEGLDSVA